MTEKLIKIDEAALLGASREELVRLAKQVSLARLSASKIGPQTDDELHAFIKEKWGIHLPRVAVSPGMSAPFDFIADIYFHRTTSAIAVANREGGKTQSAGIIHALFANFYPGYEGISAGAIGEQTKRVYQSLKRLNRSWGQDKVKESQATHIEWYNGSVVEPKDGTAAQMNGPHCHPGDELILTSEGYVPISELDPDKHFLASYVVRNDWLTFGQIHGKIKKGETSGHVGVHQNAKGQWVAQASNGRAEKRIFLGNFEAEQEAVEAVQEWRRENPKVAHPFEVTKWDFDGDLVLITTFSGSSRMTPRHKVRVKFTEQFYSSWVVYLMRKDNMWRIGMTSANRLHLRLNEETGDGIWILGVYKDKVDAVTDEIVFQARYGITGICFTPGAHSNARINDPIGVHASLADVSEPRALALLKQRGMDADLPLFGRYGHSSSVAKSERFNYHKGRWFVTAVGNLVDASGMFVVPAATDHFTETMNKDHPKDVLAIATKLPFSGPVYSIGIKPHHYYIANGLVVHNSWLLHRDEIEQFRREAFNEADNITKSGVTTDGRKFPATDIYTTSRKKAHGLLQEMLDNVDEAHKAGTIPPYKVYVWGVAETIQNQPDCQMAPENAGRPECDLCNCHRYVNGKMPDGSPRSLAKICAGRFYKSDGWRPREPDISGKFMANSAAMWDAQQECSKPATEGLILGDFSKETHGIKGWVPDPEFGKIYQGIDYGGSNAQSANWYQYVEKMTSAIDHSGNWIVIPPDSYVVFGEIYMSEIGNNKFANLIKEKEANWKSQIPFFEVEERYADIAAKSARLDFLQTHGMRTAWRITREINEHILIIQDLVSSNRIFVDESAPMWAEEAESWQWDGDTGKQLDTFNHAMSNARYAIANIERKLISEKRHPQNRNAQVGSSAPVSSGSKIANSFAEVPNTGPVTKKYMKESPHDFGKSDLPIHQGPRPAFGMDRMM